MQLEELEDMSLKYEPASEAAVPDDDLVLESAGVAPNPQPSTLNPQPSTLNPQPSTLNPQPSTLNPEH